MGSQRVRHDSATNTQKLVYYYVYLFGLSIENTSEQKYIQNNNCLYPAIAEPESYAYLILTSTLYGLPWWLRW